MRDQLFVFISSSIREFGSEREAIRKSIERRIPLSRAWTFESAPADPDSLQESYLKRVRDCDIFVLLVGSDITDPVRLEYETAKALDKPRLVFVNQSVRQSKGTEEFLNKLDLKWKAFTDSRSLQQEVVKSVYSLLIEYSKRLQLSAKDITLLQQRQRSVLRILGILSIIVFVLLISLVGVSNFASQTKNENISLRQTIIAQQPTAVALQATLQAVPPNSFTGLNQFNYGALINWTNRDDGLDNLNTLGFRWAKIQIRWCDLESSRGAINLSQTNRFMDNANAKGIKVLISVVCAPPWSRRDGGTSGSGPPDSMQDAANFIGALAQTYCNKGLGAIEVWNEQNLSTEWHGKPVSAVVYMEMLRLSYQTIKASCPSIIVVSGALTPTGVKNDFALDDVLFLQQMYENGLTKYSDAIGAHPNGFCNAPNAVPGNTNICGNQYNNHRSFFFRGTLEYYRSVMILNGDSSKQIWPTEFGWGSDPKPKPGYDYLKPISEEQQAKWLVEAYQLMKQMGYIGAAFLWNLDFGDEFHILGRPAFESLKKMPK